MLYHLFRFPLTTICITGRIEKGVSTVGLKWTIKKVHHWYDFKGQHKQCITPVNWMINNYLRRKPKEKRSTLGGKVVGFPQYVDQKSHLFSFLGFSALLRLSINVCLSSEPQVSELQEHDESSWLRLQRLWQQLLLILLFQVNHISDDDYLISVSICIEKKNIAGICALAMTLTLDRGPGHYFYLPIM